MRRALCSLRRHIAKLNSVTFSKSRCTPWCHIAIVNNHTDIAFTMILHVAPLAALLFASSWTSEAVEPAAGDAHPRLAENAFCRAAV